MTVTACVGQREAMPCFRKQKGKYWKKYNIERFGIMHGPGNHWGSWNVSPMEKEDSCTYFQELALPVGDG